MKFPPNSLPCRVRISGTTTFVHRLTSFIYTQTEGIPFKGQRHSFEWVPFHTLADQGITLYSSVFGGAYLIQQSIGGRWIDKGFPLGLGIYIYGLIQFSPLLLIIPSCPLFFPINTLLLTSIQWAVLLLVFISPRRRSLRSKKLGSGIRLLQT